METQGSWSDTSACITSIFSHGVIEYENSVGYGHSIEIYPSYVQYRGERDPDLLPPKSDSPRGKIRSFSRKARARMIQRLASLLAYPDWWQDFTFPDDVLSGKTIEERAEYSSSVLKAFKREVETFLPGIWGYWRRDWIDRKSGVLRGQECPHFHALMSWSGVTEQNYRTISLKLARIWVSVLGTSQPEKALAVACNHESYRWLSSAKMAQIYVSKYVAKIEEHEDQYSRGRFWGKIGNPPIAEPVCLRLLPSEAALLRRLFRRKVKSSSYRLHSTFRRQNPTSWLLLSSRTIEQALKWVLAETAPPF